MSLFKEGDRDEIANRIREIERETAGELVVVVAARSGKYAAPRALVALLLAVGLTQELHHLYAELSGPWLLWVLAGVAVALHTLLGIGPLLRHLVPANTMDGRVRERALAAFTAEGVAETRDRSGVLIFFSELEHRIVILADRGIHSRVEAGTWDREVKDLVSGIRAGDAKGSLLRVLDRLGELLKEAFPVLEDDKNELSNEVREMRDR